MEKQWLFRFPIALFLVACGFLMSTLLRGALPSTSATANEASLAQASLAPRFIDFDIGAATVRSGASHQNSSGIPDLAPYVQLPNSGSPLTMVNFTLPPDFATGTDLVVRVLYSATGAPCFFVPRTSLEGYGPRDTPAIYDPYWPGESQSSDDSILRVDQSFQTHEVLITFRSTASSYAAYPGDIMTLRFFRLSSNTNDTCTSHITVRSISITYQGHTSYMPTVNN